MSKLSQKTLSINGHDVTVGLVGDVGYICINDRNLYPDEHSGSVRHDMGFDSMMISCMTRNQLIDLKKTIDNVLKQSK